MKYTIQYRQSIFDVAIQLTGTIEGYIQLLSDNNLSFYDDLNQQKITVADDYFENDWLVGELYNTKKILATAATTDNFRIFSDEFSLEFA